MSNILRYNIPLKEGDERLKDILQYCQRTGCSEVLLFTSSYDFQPSFIKIDEIKKYVSRLRTWIDILKSNKIEVGINVLQTLGHIYFPKDLSGDFPFQRRVSIKGTESAAGACPLDKKLQDYVSQVYSLFADLQPGLIFVDDDFRYSLDDSLTCFCPLHMKKLSERIGYEMSGKELAEKLLDSDDIKPNRLREEFHDVQVQALNEMAAVIRKAVDSASPESRIGLMTAGVPGGLWGHDFRLITKTLAGCRHKSALRPQIGVYHEIGDPHEYLGQFYQPSIVRNLVGNNVELYPEIENYTYTAYSKSVQMTLLQMATVHMQGCHKLALNIFDMFGSPFDEYEDIISMLEQRKEYFAELTRTIPEGVRSQGIAIWQHVNGILHKRMREDDKSITNLIPLRHADKYLPLLGLPAGFDWEDSPHIFLSGDDVLALSPEEQNELLKRGAVMDRSACEALIDSGWGERIGVYFGDTVNADDSGCERFETVEFCEGYANRWTPVRIWTRDGQYRSIINAGTAAVTVLSNLYNYKGNIMTPLVVATENKTGERFGVLAFDLDDTQRLSFVNLYRRVQMRNLFEWIAHKKLPVVVLDQAFVVPFHVMLEEHTCIVSLSNYSTGPVNSVMLELSAGMPLKVEYLAPEGRWIEIDSCYRVINNKYLKLSLPLAAFDIHILKFIY